MPIIDQGFNPLLPGFNTGKMLGFSGRLAASLEIYSFIFESIRAEDSAKGGLLLKRWLEGMQQEWISIGTNIDRIKTLWSVTQCPDELLCHLAFHVGWTSEYQDLICNLDPIILRRLIASSIELWDLKGTEPGMEAILNVVFGVGIRIWNWFYYRWVSDENIFGEDRDGLDTWNIDLPQDGDDEYRTTLRIVDDGTLPRAKILGFLEVFRVIKEILEVVWIGYLELFEGVGDDSQIASPQIVDLPSRVGNGLLLLNDGAAFESVYASLPRLFDWGKQQHYVGLRAIFQGVGGKRFGTIFLYQNEANHMRVEFNGDTHIVSLIRIVGNIPVVLATFDYDDVDSRIYGNVWYGIRVNIREELPNSPFQRIKVYIDNELRFNVTDDLLPTGTFGVYHDIGTIVECREIEGFELPLDRDEIGP